jgi:hypothetical protein
MRHYIIHGKLKMQQTFKEQKPVSRLKFPAILPKENGRE